TTVSAGLRRVSARRRDRTRQTGSSSDRPEETTETVRVIDWDGHTNNDYFLASQLWISGEMYKRRADLVGFVNGIPLIFIELKAAQKNVEAETPT
ncbi:MAG: hypothetical protein HGA76_10490, partial [Candidatus Firestonebacteria bacterium]|nr:hypothetical protein [Candidatus Firestonebacteria bacterium]